MDAMQGKVRLDDGAGKRRLPGAEIAPEQDQIARVEMRGKRMTEGAGRRLAGQIERPMKGIAAAHARL
jgi:hypothetical protein